CNVLVLFQCIALHPDTKMELINAQIPSYLFPFLQSATYDNPINNNLKQQIDMSENILKSREFEYLKLTSLGVFGSLVKSDSFEVIKYLLSTEIVPQCLKIMEVSSELSKTVALFIFMRIILNENGLNYICLNEVRLVSVINVLNSMVSNISPNSNSTNNNNSNTANANSNNPNGKNGNDNNAHPGRILKNLLRCYLRLCDDLSVRSIVKEKIPASLVIALDPQQQVNQEYIQLYENVKAIRGIISEDATVNKLLKQLLEALGLP
ncbi:Rcd1-like protein, partial [Hanseniaspora valbyensis NRRL Y-1626]